MSIEIWESNRNAIKANPFLIGIRNSLVVKHIQADGSFNTMKTYTVLTNVPKVKVHIKFSDFIMWSFLKRVGRI